MLRIAIKTSYAKSVLEEHGMYGSMASYNIFNTVLNAKNILIV